MVQRTVKAEVKKKRERREREPLGEEKNVDLAPVQKSGTPARSKTQIVGAKARSTMRNVALDLGKRKISLSEVANGEVILRTTVRELNELKRYIGSESAPARVAFEACHGAWRVAAWVRQCGHEPVMVDTTRSRQMGIGHHGRKTDRIDADVIALALDRNQIPVAHILSPERQALRYQLTVRRALVETRAQIVTTARELTRARGFDVASCSVEGFVKTLDQAQLDKPTRALVEPLRAVLLVCEKNIAASDLELDALCKTEGAIPILTTAPGVALIVAAAFVSVIDDAGRFRNADQVASYLGLVPSENTTGGKQRLGAITKQGNSYVRALLVQAAWCILRSTAKKDPLVRWGKAVADRRGKRIAVVAIARRLSGILWAMWRDQTVYQPEVLGVKGATGLHRQAQTTEALANQMRADALKLSERKLAQRRRKATRVMDAVASLSLRKMNKDK